MAGQHQHVERGGQFSTPTPKILFGRFLRHFLAGCRNPAESIDEVATGTPDDIPSSFSFHGIMHAIAPPLAFISLVAVFFVLARRLVAQDRGTAAITTIVIAVVCLLLVVPVGPGTSWRLFAGVALGFAWITAYAVGLSRNSIR